MIDLWICVPHKGKRPKDSLLFTGLVVLDRRGNNPVWNARTARVYPTQANAERNRSMTQRRMKLSDRHTVVVVAQWRFSKISGVQRSMFPGSYMAPVVRLHEKSIVAKCRKAAQQWLRELANDATP